MLQCGLVSFKKWLKSEDWGIGLLRTNGELIIEPSTLLQLGEFGNGLAHAKVKMSGIMYSGFINMKTNIVILNVNQ